MHADAQAQAGMLRQQEANQLVPGNAHYLSLLSKQWSDITFIPTTPKAEAKSCAEKGLAIAQEVRIGGTGRAQVSCGRMRLHCCGRCATSLCCPEAL